MQLSNNINQNHHQQESGVLQDRHLLEDQDLKPGKIEKEKSVLQDNFLSDRIAAHTLDSDTKSYTPISLKFLENVNEPTIDFTSPTTTTTIAIMKLWLVNKLSIYIFSW